MNAGISINDFLGQKRIAVVGVSRNPDDFSRHVVRELARKQFDVVPVNQRGGSLEGRPCFTRVQDISPPVDGALLMTPPQVTELVVKDCVEAGIKRVWMHQGIGPGAVSESAAAFCRDRGVTVIEGACPLMFLRQPALPHRLHGALLRLFGRHPEQQTSRPASST